jgi:hypothetical protein
VHKIKLLTLLTALTSTGVIAMASASAAAPTISKAYYAKSSLTTGSIVRLLPGSKNTIAVANVSTPRELIGVSESSNESLLAINPSSSTVQVAISGAAETLVSTINGNIKQGDYVAVSPFGGMGMESEPGDYDVGIALANFSSQSDGAKQQKVTNTSGRTTSVWTGEIPVNIAVGVDNGNNSANANLNNLQKLARSLTGHTISTGRVIAAMTLAVLAFATLVTLTYSATYGSIVSIGRNPLAKIEILKGLRVIVTAVVVIALVAGLLIYLLLS